MNRITLTGRLVRDPELVALAGDKQVCRMRIAVDGMGRGDQAGFIDVSEFGEPGRASSEVLAKGWLIAVDGRLDFHEWTPNGTDNPRSAIAVIGRVEFLTAPQAKTEPIGEAIAA